MVALGTVAAVLLARFAVPVLADAVPSSLAGGAAPALNLRAIAYAGLLAAGAALLFGLAPALHEGAAGKAPARHVAVRSDSGRSRPRSALVIAQIAFSVVLALGAGLLLRSVSALGDVRPGFEPEEALVFKVTLRVPSRYGGPAARAQLMKDIETRLAELPGVRAVGLVGALPLSGERWTQPYGLPGQAEHEWVANRADFRVMTSGYLPALGARLLEGRTFTAEEDLVEGERVVVVDEHLAARISPRGSALDAIIGVPLDGQAVWARVVGVVEHVRQDALEADGREAIYVPYRQEASREVWFVVRTAGSPAAIAPAVRQALLEIDRQIPVHEVSTLSDYVDRAIAPRRFALAMLAAFAALALLCTSIGLYGVVAFDVGRRTRELGVRMAVGATRADVARSVLGRAMRLAAGGLAVGVILTVIAAPAFSGMTFGVRVSDPTTWGAVVGLVAVITGVASWIPARRASRLSPTSALTG
jgi:predicted permease